MDEPISATDANRHFSALIRGVQDGQSYVVTSHGRPVARIVPVPRPRPATAGAARKRVLARLQKMPALAPRLRKRADAYENLGDDTTAS